METVIDLPGGVRQSRMITMPSAAEIPNDTAVVCAARHGSREAFGRLYSRFSPMVHGIVLARVPHHEAEDLVQEVFLIALRQLHTLRDDAAFPGWLAQIARNRAKDHYRRKVENTQLPENLAAQQNSDSDALAVLAAIRRLPEAYRETLILRLVEGMTGEEISARTGLRPASVRVNLHRGMGKLRKLLGKEGRP